MLRHGATGTEQSAILEGHGNWILQKLRQYRTGRKHMMMMTTTMMMMMGAE